MKLRYIDSIRGIAVLMVILVHTSQHVYLKNSTLLFLTNFGQLGVQLFFVASAYTLCLSSEKRKDETNHNLKYAIRRYFRIAPAYYSGILIYFIINITVNKIVMGNFIIPEKYSFLNVLSNIFFFHGFYEPGNNTIVPGGWSIGTEMAFYVIFPILFKTLLHFVKSSKDIVLFLLFGISFCFISLFLLYLNGIVVTKNYFIYFNLINQLPVFLIGISYYFYREKLKLDWNHKLDIYIFLLLTTLTLFIFYKNLNFLFPISAGFSYVFLIELFKKYQFLNKNILVRIGQVSFSMYLLHFIFAVYFTPFLASRLNLDNEFMTLLIFYFFSIATTFICALFFEKIIEKPGIEIGKILIKKLN